MSSASTAQPSSSAADASSASTPGNEPTSSEEIKRQQNFRQAGTSKANGRLLLGAAHAYHASNLAQSGVMSLGSVPSIPSRFETVLYGGDVEKDAFLSRVPRFNDITNPARDLPGPGAYYTQTELKEKNLSSLKLHSTSFSQKGYGVGFVSKAPRFRRRYAGPGPGQYDPLQSETLAERSMRDASRPNVMVPGTAAFKPPMNAPLNPALSTSLVNSTPGPGQYDNVTKIIPLTLANQKRLAKKKGVKNYDISQLGANAARLQANHAALLHAAAHSPASIPSSTKPMPSASEFAVLSKLATSAAHANPSLPEPGFLSSTARFKDSQSNAPTAPVTGHPHSQLHPQSLLKPAGPGTYNPKPVLPKSRAFTEVFRSSTQRTQFAANPHVPGPGAYLSDEKEKDITNPQHTNALLQPPSRVFRVTNVDRFGHVTERRTLSPELPGPGHYDPQLPQKRLGAFDTALIQASSSTPALNSNNNITTSQSAEHTTRRRRRAAGHGGLGQGLVGTKGGSGIVLNSPTFIKEHTTSPTRNKSPTRATSPTNSHSASTSALLLSSHIKAPGPAYYSPDVSKVKAKKSFHLNSQGSWV